MDLRFRLRDLCFPDSKLQHKSINTQISVRTQNINQSQTTTNPTTLFYNSINSTETIPIFKCLNNIITCCKIIIGLPSICGLRPPPPSTNSTNHRIKTKHITKTPPPNKPSLPPFSKKYNPQYT